MPESVERNIDFQSVRPAEFNSAESATDRMSIGTQA